MAKFSTVLLASSVPLVVGHGVLTKPVSRQMLLSETFGVGLTNPGAGDCGISAGNGMNMNGCQGAGGVSLLQLNCWVPCNGNLQSEDSECKSCKDQTAREYEKNLNPEPRLGVCGDIVSRNAFSTNFDSKICQGMKGEGDSCIEKALSQPFDEITLADDNSFVAEMLITAHHWGWAEFRLCREGGMGKDNHGVTQECFNKDVLRFDVEDAKQRYPADKMSPGIAPGEGYTPQDPSDYIGTHPSARCDGPGDEIANFAKLQYPQIWAPPGSCCYKGGDCGNSNVSRTQDIRFVFPNPQASVPNPDEVDNSGGNSGVAMNGVYKVKLFLPEGLSCTQEKPCTLQWLFMTGNSRDSYPEAFRNCADFKLASGPPTPPTTPAPKPTLAPVTSPTLAPEISPTPAPTPPFGQEMECDAPANPNCKSECSKACNGAVQTNQCYAEWDGGRFIQCACTDGTTMNVAGCECTGNSCGKPETPTSAPAPNPTAAPTRPPTLSPTSQGGSCVPDEHVQWNPASKADCARCGAPDYYEWWPCNANPKLCTGSCGPAPSALQSKKVKRHSGKRLRASHRAAANEDEDITAYMQHSAILHGKDDEDEDELEDDMDEEQDDILGGHAQEL
eukprot:TRINITY_DN65167_c0_g1_i1.p1 TRINITY_DN65167_c0_g1~~TRINITY_DN65167_c0_g1_i1.p1  ORF type:complete len:616 (+),score=80.27 TRINITY_DN65167_c0_g1_i1:66-1913(+)